MYPREQLTLLSHRKAVLQTRIALQRLETAQHLEQVTRPLVWLQNLRAKWRSLPPAVRLLSGPAGLLLQSFLRKRLRFGGTLLVWGPIIWRTWKWVAPLLDRSARSPSSPGKPVRITVSDE